MHLLAIFACILVILTGCTGGNKPTVEPAAAVEEAPQDSLRAKFLLTLVDQEGKAQDLDAVLFSVPGKRYRMELTGPMGVGVASMLWKEEGWTMTFPTEKLYMKGAGYMVGLLTDNSLPMVHIHQVAALFEGKLLPENYDVVERNMELPDSLMDPSVQVTYAREKSGKNFAFGKRDSSVVWLSRMGRDGQLEVLKFSEVKSFEGVSMPSIIAFEKGGTRFLGIRIKKIAHNKPFSLGTWRLNVPRSFTQVGL